MSLLSLAKGCLLVIFYLSGMIFFLYLTTLVSLSLTKRNVLLLVADDFRQIHENHLANVFNLFHSSFCDSGQTLVSMMRQTLLFSTPPT